MKNKKMNECNLFTDVPTCMTVVYDIFFQLHENEWGRRKLLSNYQSFWICMEMNRAVESY